MGTAPPAGRLEDQTILVASPAHGRLLLLKLKTMKFPLKEFKISLVDTEFEGNIEQKSSIQYITSSISNYYH